MSLNLPHQVRLTIYVLVIVGTSIIVPLYANGVVSDTLMAVWTSVSGAVSALAAFNVTPDDL